MRLFVALGFVALTYAWPSFVRADTPAPTAPTTVTASPRPLVFYQGVGTFSGGSYTETLNRRLEAHVHDKLLPELAATFGTRIIDLKSADYSQADLARVCRSNGAVGVLQFTTAWSINPSATTVIGTILNVQSCGGTSWFQSGGSDKETTARDVADEMMEKALTQLIGDLHGVTDRTPNAKSNFVRYGLYMNDAESDSFWTLDIEDGKTVVDSCDPIGTAFRAGLRVGDVVTEIDGTSTAGADQAKLNAILEDAKKKSPWVLTVRRNGASKDLQFENQLVSWYAAHPVP